MQSLRSERHSEDKKSILAYDAQPLRTSGAFRLGAHPLLGRFTVVSIPIKNYLGGDYPHESEDALLHESVDMTSHENLEVMMPTRLFEANVYRHQ